MLLIIEMTISDNTEEAATLEQIPDLSVWDQ
jgi:hypothetical protein